MLSGGPAPDAVVTEAKDIAELRGLSGRCVGSDEHPHGLDGMFSQEDNSTSVHRTVVTWRVGMTGPMSQGERAIANETPVALSYDGSTHAVMMATPADLEDFAIGFSLSEGIIDNPADVASMDIVQQPAGWELRIWLSRYRSEALSQRRRHMAGPTGCGLCGLESLEEAVRPVARLPADEICFDAAQIAEAVAALRCRQPLHSETGAVHAAALWSPGRSETLVREDIARHNALDKLVGAVSLQQIDLRGAGLLLTSRISVEMVQKTARLGVPLLVAISAPTALALQLADEAGVTVVAIARDDGFQVFTHTRRVIATA